MNKRHLLALVALVAAAAVAGCGFGPQEIPQDQLTTNASYDWNTNATVTFDLDRRSYTAVVNVTNSSELDVWGRDAIDGDVPVDIKALRFRYPNGTVVNATHANLSAVKRQERTRISLPADEGLVGYTASRGNKQFASPAFVGGSYEIVLPPGTRVGLPLLSQASPGGWSSNVEDNRMTVRWDNVTRGSVSVRFYLQRDILIFGSLFGVALLVGIVGTVYYLRRIRDLEATREELGLDVDTGDDDVGDDGPPPGMG